MLGAGVLYVISAQDAEGQQPERIAMRLHVAPSGMVTVLTGKVDVGQGLRTLLTQAAAEELRLPAEKVDLAIMVDVYHEFEFPYEMLVEISRSLKTGGRIAFVEYRLEDETVPIKLVHKMSQAQVKKEASLPELRLKWQKTIDTLPWQHIILFEKLAAEELLDKSK